MFRKENSSCCSKNENKGNSGDNRSNNNPLKSKKGVKQNKKAASSAPTFTVALDVPLRKSDIRQLRQRVKDFFSVTDDKKVEEHSDKTSDKTSDDQQRQQQQQQQQQQIELLASVLDKVFLPGCIATRQLHHVELGKLVLYVRTPDTKVSSPEDSGEFVWPYVTSQVLWISQPPMPNSSQVEVNVPTLALLSVLPLESMPTVYIPSPASKFLCRGAHLMRAGMMNFPLAASTNNDNSTTAAGVVVAAPTSKNSHYAALIKKETHRVVAISVAGNPQPCAVGVLDSGVQSAADIGPGTKGVGATVWTCYGDDLWQQQIIELDTLMQAPPSIISPYGGANYNDGHYGNVGFINAESVVPIVNSAGREDEDEREELDISWDIVDADEVPTEGEHSVSDTDEQTGDGATIEPSTETKRDNPEVEKTEPLLHDEILHEAVCKALLTSISPKDLPMTVANFYANHVLPNRPPGTTIQLKQTKYKKFGNYLKQQFENKLLALGPGPDKHSKDKTGYLVSFDKRHPTLLEYKQDHAEEVQHAKDAQLAAVDSAKHKLVLVNLYIVPHHFISLLQLNLDVVKGINASSPERAGTGMLTLPELRTLLEDYLERENLIEYDQVRLNGPLFDALYKKTKKAEITNDTLTVSRKEVADQWVKCMDTAYALVQMPGSKVLKLGRGKPPKVQIEVSMRQSRKFITKVRGMEAYSVNGQVLAKDVGKRLACQATVETESEGAALPKGCVEIVLGGNFASELEALLLGDENLCPGHGGIKNSDYKLPKNSIEVVLRKGVPGRKPTKKVNV